MQYGHSRERLTPHLEFLRGIDGEAPIDRGELVRIISGTSRAWEEELFMLETAGR